ncbi:cell division protein ZapA [Rhodothermus bifroesti]|nr:cell division protein ZapA [Rhodothermus bifroesti]GBD00703.1 hypothetical protein HRbin18_00415 [bacterium HR18]
MDTRMEKSIRVTIMGRDYPLRIRPEDEELMRQLAASIDEKMRAFRAAHPDQPELTAAVIVALSLAEALHETQTALRALDAELYDTFKELLDWLEHPERIATLPESEQPDHDAI